MTELSRLEANSLPLIEFLEAHYKNSNFKVFQLAGDASARRYFRILQRDPAEPKKEETAVLMVWEPFDNVDDYPFLNVLQLFKENNIPVPEVLSVSPEKGLLLLEDLGDLTLERKFWENQDQVQVLGHYHKAIEHLLKIHFSCTSSPSSSSVAHSIKFDVEKLLWEMNYGKRHLLESFCQLSLGNTAQVTLEKQYLSICETLAEQSKWVCHRDYHSRNLMLKWGELYVIDFQDARLGPLQYDLVSLLKDSYVDLKPEIREQLLLAYYNEAKNFSAVELDSYEDFQRLYELQSIQRCFKACGSFASFYNNRGDRRYLKYLPRTLKSVRASLELFPQYQDFLNVLADNGLFERKFEVSQEES